MNGLNPQAHPLTVFESRPMINGKALNLMFDVPDKLNETFRWIAGQHITLCLELERELYRRPYSICVPPNQTRPLSITVKRVPGGRVSNHINDTIRAGSVLEIMPPFGGFTLQTDPSHRRTHYFYAAGSGITPIRAMIGAVLADEPHSVAHLVYGNVSQASTLFSNSLDAWAEQYPDRFSLNHVLSRPGFWSSSDYWRTGRIDTAAVEAFVTQHAPYAQDTQHHICGPAGMNATVRDALIQLDVPNSRIHMESFGGESPVTDDTRGRAASLTVRYGDDRVTIPVAEDQTLLDAMKQAKLEPPYACESGVCGACRVRLVSGDVSMRRTMALDNDERDAGIILACQSLAQSESIELHYD